MKQILQLNALLSETSIQSNQSIEPSLIGEVASKGVYLLTAAVLGFTFNVLLDVYRKRSEETKRLSYSIDYGEATKVIKVYEEQLQAESKIVPIYFYLENSGDKILKEQNIRLMSSNGSTISKVDLIANPEREMGLEKRKMELDQNEVAYSIEYMKPKQRIGFKLVVETLDSISIKLEAFHKSNTEDVLFEPQEEVKIRKDRDVIQRFISLCLFFWIVPIPFETPIRIGAASSLQLT